MAGRRCVQRVLVVGGTRGLGLAIAQRFAADGAAVATAGRTAPSLSPSPHLPATMVHVSLDVTSDSQDVTDAVAGASVALGGSIDTLVYAAGVTRDSVLARVRDADALAVLQTNLLGCIRVCRAALRAGGMLEPSAAGRSITVVGSAVATSGAVGQSVYAASKAGLTGLARSLAREMASRDVRVNVLAPGYIDAGMTKTLTTLQRDALLQRVPMRRAGSLDDVADAAVWLASARYVTGQVIHVDGGLSIGAS